MDLHKIQDYLAEEGYRPTRDEDGSVSFKSEGKFFVIDTYPDDEQFIRLVAPNIWEIDSERELQHAIIEANKATCNIKSAKVFVLENQENVWATLEMFVADVDHFVAVLPRCLSAVAGVVRDFQDGMRHAMADDGAEAGPLPKGQTTETRPPIH